VVLVAGDMRQVAAILNGACAGINLSAQLCAVMGI
jgi:hypothetical protein